MSDTVGFIFGIEVVDTVEVVDSLVDALVVDIVEVDDTVEVVGALVEVVSDTVDTVDEIQAAKDNV